MRDVRRLMARTGGGYRGESMCLGNSDKAKPKTACHMIRPLRRFEMAESPGINVSSLELRFAAICCCDISTAIYHDLLRFAAICCAAVHV